MFKEQEVRPLAKIAAFFKREPVFNLPFAKCGEATAPFAVQLVGEIKRRSPEVDKVLMTQEDAKNLLQYASKNKDNKKLIDAYFRDIFGERVWLGTMVACPKKDTPIGEVMKDGYLVSEYNQIAPPLPQRGTYIRTGREPETSVNGQKFWRFPVNENILRLNGYSLDSANIRLELDLIADGKLTCNLIEMNNIFTTQVWHPEYIRIFDNVSNEPYDKTQIVQYGLNAYVGLKSYKLTANSEGELEHHYFLPDPYFMAERGFVAYLLPAA